MDKKFRYVIYLFAFMTVQLLITLFVYLYLEASPFFAKNNVLNFIFGRKWRSSEVGQSFQIFNILCASFYISILACIISLIVSYGVSLYVCFYANKRLKKIILWLINILSGIPSIIYGFFGMIVILNMIEKIFRLSTGETVLAGSITLSIMVIPFFVNVLVENINLIKIKYERDFSALGLNKEYFIKKIVFKELKMSILTAYLLAFSRAIGETMAVMLVIGNAPVIPKLLSKAETIPALIALEVGMSEVGSEHYRALFSASFVLLIIILVVDIVVFILNEMRKKYDREKKD